MRDRHQVRSYDYVNHRYEDVCRRLLADPLAAFRRKLHVQVAGVDIGAEIDLRVTGSEDAVSPFNQAAIKIHLVWEATQHPEWFPTMVATLWVYPLSHTETQLELEGHYQPPLGAIGDAIDAVVLHRVAKQSVKTLVSELATSLREDLAKQPRDRQAVHP